MYHMKYHCTYFQPALSFHTVQIVHIQLCTYIYHFLFEDCTWKPRDLLYSDITFNYNVYQGERCYIIHW